MDLQQYLRTIRRYLRSAVATLLACISVAAIWTLVKSPVYTSESSIFLSVESGASAGELSQGASYAERQVKSFVTVATSAAVLQPVIEDLGLDTTPPQFAENLEVSSPLGTSIIAVAAEDEDPVRAAAIANAVAESLTRAVENLSPSAPEGAKLVAATVIEPAVPSESPSEPRPLLNLALGTLLGVALGLGQALLRSTLDTRIRNVEDLECATTAPILGTIGHLEATGDRVAPTEGQHWANAEAYRRLRTNVGFVGLGGERRPSMVITSSLAAEGKTETSVNLARVLAQAGESVLLVDADLRRPEVAARMRIDSELGLSDVLTGRGTFEDMVIDIRPGYLSVLPAGTIPPNPSELLGSEAMSHLLATVERRYDHVIFDAPPLLPVTDAVVLASQTSGAIIVARSGKVRRPEFEHAQELLEAVSAPILGLVLNDVPVRRRDSHVGYYTSHDAVPRGEAEQRRARALIEH